MAQVKKAERKPRRPRLTRSIRFGAEWSKIEAAARILTRRNGIPVTATALVRSGAEEKAQRVLEGASPDEVRAAGGKL